MIRRAIVPFYLLACLLLGGASAAGLLPNLLLQLIALGILFAAFAVRTEDRMFAHAPLLLAALLVALFALQLVPLPPALWSHLPGRAAAAAGYALLGTPAPPLPLSLTPARTVADFLWLLPAFAVLLGMMRLGAFDASWIAWTIVIVALLSVAVGALQVVGGADSPWYFYETTNWGQAVGFFANSNHTATLLVVSIPFLAALQASGLRQRGPIRRASALLVITFACFIVIAIGLVINFSLAGLGLSVPVALASFTLLGAESGPRLRWGGIATAALGIAAVLLIFIAPFGNNLTSGASADLTDAAQLTRSLSIGRTLRASINFLPFGSGIGSFQSIYPTLEDPRTVIATYMNHAHSDLAEILLETGLFGPLLILLTLLWWVRRTIALWRAPKPDSFARAAAIASGAIMAHSLVDYPLRTAAISAVFAACLALMSEVRPFVPAQRARSDARHRSIE